MLWIGHVFADISVGGGKLLTLNTKTIIFAYGKLSRVCCSKAAIFFCRSIVTFNKHPSGLFFSVTSVSFPSSIEFHSIMYHIHTVFDYSFSCLSFASTFLKIYSVMKGSSLMSHSLVVVIYTFFPHVFCYNSEGESRLKSCK